MMTEPTFKWQVSLGNVIQMVLLIIAGAIGWATFDARITANETALRNGNKVQSEHELRLRKVETDYARTDERLASILSILGKIDAKLEQMERQK